MRNKKKSAKRSREDISKSHENIELPRNLGRDSLIETVPCLYVSQVPCVSSDENCEFLNCNSDAEPPVIQCQPSIPSPTHSTPIQPEMKTDPDPKLSIEPKLSNEKVQEKMIS